jgi:hypothetical protein
LAKDWTALLNSGRVYAKLTEKINEMLTEKQKEAVKKTRRSWGGPGGNAPRGSRPGVPDDDSMETPEEQGPDLFD